MTSVWYESPQRIVAALADVEAIDARRRVFVLREYTKLHEQHVLGTASEVAATLELPVRGEIVLVIEGQAPEAPAIASDEIDAAIDALLDADASVSAIAKTLVERGFGERRHLYALVTGRKQNRKRA